MMSSRLIAVSQRVDIYPDRRERRDAYDQRLMAWILEAGYLPVPVPNSLVKVISHGEFNKEIPLFRWLDKIKPDAILLSGGNDIGDVPERDSTEQFLLEFAEKHHLPLLGICRGMQMIANYAGTGLISIDNHVSASHAINSICEEYSRKSNVNSFHQYALASCPDGFDVCAIAQDGVIEAIRHKTLPWQGWMWHPERENEFSASDMANLKRLFD